MSKTSPGRSFTREEAAMQSGNIKIVGIHSQLDADKVLQALNEVWGVRNAEVHVSKSEAVFSFDEKAASYQDFEQAIKDSGFDVKKD
jgi:copper chaperone